MSIKDIAGLRYNNVFIATPTHICKRYCASRFLEAVERNADGAFHCIVDNSGSKAIKSYYPERKDRHVDSLKEMTPKDAEGKAWSIHERIVGSMNYCLGVFLNSFDKKHEWFLSLESDVILDVNTIQDLILTADKHCCKVVHSNCYPGFNKSLEICETDRLTLGCTLIHRSVFDSERFLCFRYDKEILAAFHDAFFAIDCKERGIKMIYNPFIKVLHMHAANKSRGWEELPSIERNGK
jgi:hypothetical protein